MSNIRLIARLDIKGQNLIKGIHLEGLRVMGDPQKFALKYYLEGVDELLYMDTVASLYNRNNLKDIVEYTTHNIFIPITVGGGIRSVEDAQTILNSGADKIAINTAAIKNPLIISDISRRLGSQCMVISIEAKRLGNNYWEAYHDNGREKTGLDVVEWAIKAQSLGAGEILLTSVDQEGTRKGFDIELIQAVSTSVSIPVIASGGMGTFNHLVDAVNIGHADAIAMADILHYQRMTLNEIRKQAKQSKLNVRNV